MKYLLIYCAFFLLVGCTSEPVKTSAPSPNRVEMPPDEKPLFWKEVCNLDEFIYMYDCNVNDCYQIELLNSPFKDFVVITLDISDSTKDIIFYNRFKYGSPFKENNKKRKMNNELVTMINPLTKDTIKYFYTKNSKIIINPKDTNVNIFLSKTIWELYDKDQNTGVFDPETWKIKGRSGNREIVLSRHSFKDSIYYTNIQNILDVCKIKDYKYVKR